MNVSRETSERLSRYLDLLTTWSSSINLVARQTLEDGWNRHIADSLQLITLRKEPGSDWVDLGSGGGLPGIVVAIAAPWPDTRFKLVEADHRKAAFLRHTIRDLQLKNVVVEVSRIEALTPCQATTITARALAPLPKLMSYVARHLAQDGAALLSKGRTWRNEVQEAQQTWMFDFTPHPSTTHPDGAVLEVRNIRVR